MAEGIDTGSADFALQVERGTRDCSRGRHSAGRVEVARTLGSRLTRRPDSG
jgi:hypothetical protein